MTPSDHSVEADHEAPSRGELLQQVTARMARVQTIADVASVFSLELTSMLGAATAWVGLVADGGDTVEALGWAGYSEVASGRWTSLQLADRIPVTDVVRTGVPQFWETLDAVVDAYPERATAIRDAGQESVALMPLPSVGLGGAEPGSAGSIGGVVVGFREQHEFDDETRTFYRALAQQCALAIERARLFDAEQTARARTERLLGTSISLSRASSSRDIADIITNEGVSALDADGGAVYLVSDSGEALLLISERGFSEDTKSVFHAVPIASDTPLAEVARTGRPLYFESVDALRVRFPAMADSLSRTQRHAWVGLPLRTERVAGVLVLAFNRSRTFSTNDRLFASMLAQQCAQTMERARLLEAERRARAEAEDANRSKSEFLATMSHELRTPLNAIAGYTELLELGLHGPVSGEQVAVLGRIQRNQKHLLSLINEVLNFARLEAGVVRYELAAVSVAESIGALESFVLPLVRGKALHWTVAPVDAALNVQADAEKLDQILMNLVSNAIKFTNAPGEVVVTTEERELSVAIAVHDTGVGIPAAQLQDIFEPFVQVGRSKSSPRDGAGLGLAISRSLARGMLGDILVDSAPGEGSTFTLLLPKSVL